MTALHRRAWFRLRHALMRGFITKPQPRPLVYLGSGAAQRLALTIGQLGLRNVLVVTDKPLRALGALDTTLEALQQAGVAAAIFDGVLPDPTEAVVDAGLRDYRQANCDAVLAFGGGSSIDAAKVIALCAANHCTAAASIGLKQCKLPAVPFFAVPTTAGTGSEATFIAVISNNQTHEKGAVVDPSLIPKAAALDPDILRGMPASITATTGMDALTHAIESYLNRWQTADTDYFALAACRLIFDHLPEACRNGDNLQAREAMALASHYGGLAITNALVGYAHAISHNLGAKYGVPHGLGNAMVLPHVLELMKDTAAGKLADIAVHCGMGERRENESALAEKVIARVWALNDAIGIPRTTDVIREEDIDALVAAAIAEGGNYPSPRFITEAECRGVLCALRA